MYCCRPGADTPPLSTGPPLWKLGRRLTVGPNEDHSQDRRTFEIPPEKQSGPRGSFLLAHFGRAEAEGSPYAEGQVAGSQRGQRSSHGTYRLICSSAPCGPTQLGV